MLNQFSRTQLLLGAEAMEKLKGAHVAVFGIGGVGGYVCEALVRSGVGAFDLVDDDKVCLTNLNRQIIATRKTVGKYKVEVMRDRILEINPDCDVRVHQCFYLPETADQFDFSTYDYVVDAVDTITAKVTLVLEAQKAGAPHHQLHGRGQQAGCFRPGSCGYLRYLRLPAGPRNARRAAQARGQAPEGGILQRACTDPH